MERKTMTESAEKMVDVPVSSNSTRIRTAKQIMRNMEVSHGTGMILAGGTGIGKTTFVEQMGRLLGMPVITIEAPHVSEEHLINIPFVIFDPATGRKTKGSDSMPASANMNFSVKMARSYLATQLNKMQQTPDQQYLKGITRQTPDFHDLYTQLGGDANTIPPKVAALRAKGYRAILFLDEYFRQTSANVRNILRNILNKRIGNDVIPAGVYVIFASNMSDVGATLEPIASNVNMKKANFHAPTKAEWFRYFIGKFQKDQHVKLKPEVVNAFYHELSDQHIAFDDLSNNVRTSPRRWQELLLYINANVPVKSEQDAKSLLANIRANFQTETGTSNLLEFVTKIVQDIIVKTSGEEYANTQPADTGDWRRTLDQQIATKIKLGDTRKYIPVVMGLPGIGKTKAMADIATKNNLRLIDISCDTLNAEDVTGIPLQQAAGKDIELKFSEPPLHMLIEQKKAEADAAFAAHASAEQQRAWHSQKIKYIIFFDEFNRVNNQNVFNALRRVILEKTFNENYSLPEGSMVVAAMNPTDVGTVELTGHMKDTIDMIDTHPDWQSFSEFVNSAAESDSSLTGYSTQSKSIARQVFDGFVKTFAIKRVSADSNIPVGARQFYIAMGGDENMYVQPREYWTMFVDLVAAVEESVEEFSADEQTNKKLLYQSIKESMDSTLEFIMDKHKMDSSDPLQGGKWLNTMHNWLQQQMPKFMVKRRTAATLATMLDHVFANPTSHLAEDPNFINYAKNFELNKFTEDADNYFETLVKREKARYIALSKNAVTKKQIRDGIISLENDLISKFEFVVNEIKMATHIHKLSGDITDALQNSITTSLGTLIDHENTSNLQNILKSPDPSPTDKKWIEDQLVTYHAKDTEELFKKMQLPDEVFETLLEKVHNMFNQDR
jgi:MoxR-like ATPase